MKKGFTIVELLVSIGIVALLSAVMLTYSRTGERQIIIFKEQAKIIGVLSRAKSLSIAAFGDTGTNVPCGWGVHFDSLGMIMTVFKDLPSDLNMGCLSANNIYDGSSDEKFEEIKLDNKAIKFGELQLSDIIFIPPDPLIIIDNNLSKTEALIKIKTIDDQSERIIKITNAGQITSQ
ncbi:MAG: type II secretion system protein [Patescibacteria group bacterium]